VRPVVYLGEPCPHHAMQSCQSYLGFYGATENGREGQIPNLRGVAEHVSTGYNRVEGNLRASRNGLPPRSPTGNPCVRFATFSSNYRRDSQGRSGTQKEMV
jgi:hypothetical protein